MRRPLAASAVALTLAASLLGGATQAEDRSAAARGLPTRPTPVEALRAARDVLSGDSTRTPTPDRSATLALRDLYTARPRLSGASRAQADRLLARPSATKARCNRHTCVHWSTSGANSATDAWAKKTLDYLSTVWRKEVGKLDYRAPLKDGDHGGNTKLDVYLKDVGGQGVYGYTSPEYGGKEPRTASAFLVLDNDFARAEFGTRPEKALRVTAAHEFFHAVQFAYDFREDGWIMEATATWMEEQVADDVNDNRQYLDFGQLGAPHDPLDLFNPVGVGQYGQWIYFQYLQQEHGRSIVRKIWTALQGRTHWSVEVLETAIDDSFDSQYAGFVAANLLPSPFYAEGAGYLASYDTSTSLDAGPPLTKAVTLDHLTYSPRRVAPGTGLDATTWHLQVAMDGPDEISQPMLVVVWHGLNGHVRRYVVDTDAAGLASRSVRFSSANTEGVYYAVVNAGDRYDCFHGTDYACAGNSKDDDRKFSLTVSTFES
jgi:hypothetical protein